ncbi:ribosome-binding factor A [Tautonia plasticadhaerens]|uniref:ribosome-binding factor A n=1 Tax=Tautonia plasticadhaerens TaxID=2527974 RepID=UPI00119D1A7C|nr:ribosome-binding factor A [Tautonia plasticadhaerens]
MDPRRVFAPGAGRPAPRNDRKTMQLCSQVQRTVEQVILGDLDDDVLRNLCVLAVEPAPDESRLLVTVGPFASNVEIDPLQVMQHLGAASAHIRTEVAAAITRRKTPTLVYQVARPGPPPVAPAGASPP